MCDDLVAILFVIQVSILENLGALVPMNMAKRLALILRFMLHTRYVAIIKCWRGFPEDLKSFFVVDIIVVKLTFV